MLSRNAQGLYWMGRYLERVEHLSRLMQNQIESMLDSSIEETEFGWRRIYGNIFLSLPTDTDGRILSDDELARYITFDLSNTNSICFCFEQARENARQMNHCISSEMWLSLNMSYQRMLLRQTQEIYQEAPEKFYIDTVHDVNAFIGTAESTMYRDEGWNFMQLGRVIERSQLTTSLLLSQLRNIQNYPEYLDSSWIGLLHVYQVFDVYNRRYRADIRASHALNLFVTDALMPKSLRCSAQRISAELAMLAPGPWSEPTRAVERLAGRLHAMIRYEWLDSKEPEDVLMRIQKYCSQMHNLVMAAYIDYSLYE